MAVAPKDSSLDLEKESSCSICTDVLYQPLTLLDCLHTFCGSCLKEWFTWQASNAATPQPYTCPACRASVRDTRPNATVTTLSEMYLKSHPDRGKSAQEKSEMEKTYKPGDNVLPPVHGAQDSEDSEDERMLAETRELSLQDVDPERARRLTTERRRRVHEELRGGRTPSNYTAEELGRNQQTSQWAAAQRRQVEHQSSLRSLLSASDVTSQDMHEEIIRQIMEECTREGFDLDSLTPAQEEAITERIAQAIRRRQRERSGRSEGRRRQDDSRQRSQSPAEATSRRRHHTRSESGPQPSHPPVSRPHLIEAATINNRRQRDRSSSRHSQRSHRSHPSNGGNPSSLSPFSHSATDLSEHPQTEVVAQQSRSRRLSENTRRVTDPAGQTEAIRTYRERAISGEHADQRRVIPAPRQPPDFVATTQSRPRPAGPLATLRSNDGPSNSSSPSLLAPDRSRDISGGSQRPTASSASIPSPTPRQAATAAVAAIPAPFISCSRCNKPGIQYSLHYNCFKCNSGAFNLCLSCYRAGKGCLHWFGFGYAAQYRFQRIDPRPQEPPHILSARQYRRGAPSVVNNIKPTPLRPSIDEGLFCEGCFNPANSGYWHCPICNSGAWGWCNACVQAGKHCTHPSISVGHTSTLSPDGRQPLRSEHGESHPAPSGPKGAAIPLLPHVPDPEKYTPSISTSYCAICAYPIPPSHTRYHCPTCNGGRYDICTPCYHTLVSNHKIRTEDGPQGWRRCPQGHRMSVVGFEDREGGPRRVVVREMVGGWASKEDDAFAHQTHPHPTTMPQTQTQSQAKWKWREEDGTASSALHQIGTSASASQTQTLLPPDGGVGSRVQASWSYFPAEGVQDELGFPKGASITEAEDINGDWFWGVYAARKGLFPGNYGDVVG